MNVALCYKSSSEVLYYSSGIEDLFRTPDMMNDSWREDQRCGLSIITLSLYLFSFSLDNAKLLVRYLYIFKNLSSRTCR